MGICCCVGRRGGVAREETAEITGSEEGKTPGNLACSWGRRFWDTRITNERGEGRRDGKRNIFIGAVIEMKLYLVGRVGGQAGEGAVEVAVGGGSLRKLFDHVKVVLLHLIFHIRSCVQCTIYHSSPTLQ